MTTKNARPKKNRRFAIERDNGWELTVVGRNGQIHGPYTKREERPKQARIYSDEQSYRAAIRKAKKEGQ